ncbi:MAG: NAD(P)-binding domain-containing protein [Chthoniobacterales bacterium]
MARRTQKNVGIIGLGIIGRRVADCVRRRGFSTFVWNRTPRPFPNFVGSPAEIAELCDFIQIFVSDDEALLQVIQRMKQSLGAHHIVMAHSTVSPATTRAAAEIVQRRGAQLLDAPFTGSKLAAEKGELVYYIGGDEAAYRRARPVLEASSKEIIEIGEIGQATTIKIATNMVTAATVQAAAEALALVHNSGLPLEKFAEAMQGNGSNSGTLKMKLPKMLQGDFEPHFSVKHMLKDIEIASRLGRAYGLSLPATEAARDSLLDEARHGRTDDDYSSVARVFFPDGPPGKAPLKRGEEEEQSVLTGLDERAPAGAINGRAEEPVERNSHATSEIPKEEIQRDKPAAEEREEPVAAKQEEPVIEKQPEPIEDKREEAIAAKQEAPAEEKREEVAVEEPAQAEKREEPVKEKREEPIEAKREEPEIEKPAEPAEEKGEEPIVDKIAVASPKETIAEKREEPVADKVAEPPPKEKLQEALTEKVGEISPDKKTEEKIAEKPDDERNEKVPVLQSIEAKLSESTERPAMVEPVAVTKNGENGESEEEEPAEPRRSFLSRLFGKSTE